MSDELFDASSPPIEIDPREESEISLQDIIVGYVNRASADLYLLSCANLTMANVDVLRQLIIQKSPRRAHAHVCVCTFGGDPHSAYRLASCLRRHYQNGYTIVVFGPCKSAGTLLAVGAHEIILSEFGELGPLDVQTSKTDDMVGRSSGLDIFQAVAILAEHTQEKFASTFIKVISAGQGSISTKMASEIAIQLTNGLFTPMVAQLDPVRLGEMKRAIGIAEAYGERLAGNLKQGAITKLVHGYPSHNFVIDYPEAVTLFQRIREPQPFEAQLGSALEEYTRWPNQAGVCIDVEQLADSLPDSQTEAKN
jgi:hypothetical protein